MKHVQPGFVRTPLVWALIRKPRWHDLWTIVGDINTLDVSAKESSPSICMESVVGLGLGGPRQD